LININGVFQIEFEETNPVDSIRAIEDMIGIEILL